MYQYMGQEPGEAAALSALEGSVRCVYCHFEATGEQPLSSHAIIDCGDHSADAKAQYEYQVV